MMGLHEDFEEWPQEAEAMYERIESLGKGSFGTVWMAKRMVPPEDDYDYEYVALKNISIKGEKSHRYAQREICILTELRHPNVIRMIRVFPIWKENSQLVVLQLARGPNLKYLVHNRGALGFPVARLVARHLIAAVSYLHGRAVLHRDIKPTNCILESTKANPREEYDWLSDDLIWSDGPDAAAAIAKNRWKLMLVDFGFARALEESDLHDGKKYSRHSIVNESLETIEEVANMVTQELHSEGAIMKHATDLRGSLTAEPKTEKRMSMVTIPLQDLNEVEEAYNEMSSEHPHDPTFGPTESSPTEAESSPKWSKNRHTQSKRKSSARTNVRALSALGTRAYAAPEIKHDHREKTDEDKEVAREALADCVADYGMNVDAFSVGWTLRVILTGVPPNHSISSYLDKMVTEELQMEPSSCLCFCSSKKDEKEPRKLRDVSELPKEAVHLISALTKTDADDRMTVREAQSHPYISGLPGEKPYEMPLGDIPAKHGDPVVPLKCAKSL
jgi:serine/threonine protein kinase